jgi:hypothetical protein
MDDDVASDQEGFCRSEGLAAAYDDAAVHEAGIGQVQSFAIAG